MRSLYIGLCVIILLMSLSCSSQLSNPSVEFQITTESHNQHLPVIYGDVVVWEDWRNGNADIYGCILSTGEEFQISPETPYEKTINKYEMSQFLEYLNQEDPAIYGNIVVWSELKRICGYNLSTKKLFSIDIKNGYPKNPVIYGDLLLWENGSSKISGIYGYNRLTGEEFYLPGDSYEEMNPDIFKNIVVWEDARIHSAVIRGYNLETGEELQINPGKSYFFFDFSQHTPAISGDIVIWTESNGDAIYGYNLSTHEKFPIALSQISRCKKETKWKVAGSTAPALYGDMVVWVDCRNGNEDIFGYNIATGEEFQITSNEKDQKSPAIYENIVVWEDNRNGQWDIYGMDISGLTPTGGNESRTILLFREYFYKFLIMGSLMVYLIFLGKGIYYDAAFIYLKKEIPYKKDMSFRYEKIPSIVAVLVQFGLINAFIIMYFYMSTSNRICFLFAIGWIALEIFFFVYTPWRIFCPYIYVGNDYLLKFPKFPGKWRKIKRESIEHSQYRIKIFELQLKDGTTEIIDGLKVHKKDEERFMKTMKEFLQ